MNTPEISVVMAVYNGASDVERSVSSVLKQEGVDLELIVVDDGSSDSTPSVLARIAATDRRLKVITQPNAGLTAALVRGCSAVRGTYIARQDSGDVFLAGKLASQKRVLDHDPSIAMVSCGTRFVGPGNEMLYEVSRTGPAHPSSPDAVTTSEVPSSHPSVVMRRQAYERVGGYREPFYFAQDLDLWSRLMEVGPHVALRSVLMEARFSYGTTSGGFRGRQIQYRDLVAECVAARKSGADEGPILERARAIGRQSRRSSGSNPSHALYFIGSCLAKRQDARAAHYFRLALKENPLHVKAALRWLVHELSRGRNNRSGILP